jgi:hypothetical protein
MKKEYPDKVDGKKAGVYEASDGKKYSIIGMTLMELQTISDEVEAEWIRKGFPLPKPPMQRLAPQFGDPDQFFLIPFTEKTIIDEGTNYDKRLWEAYQHALGEYNKLSAKRMLSAIVSRIIVPQETLIEFLEDRRKLTGCVFVLPEDEEVIKRMFIEVNVIGARTEDDMVGAISNILMSALKVAGVITDSEVDKITELFRNRGHDNTETSDTTNDTAKASGTMED